MDEVRLRLKTKLGALFFLNLNWVLFIALSFADQSPSISATFHQRMHPEVKLLVMHACQKWHPVPLTTASPSLISEPETEKQGVVTDPRLRLILHEQYARLDTLFRYPATYRLVLLQQKKKDNIVY